MDSITLTGPERPPASGGKPKSLVILLHGLGASGDDLIGLVPFLAPLLPKTHFISPNAGALCDMGGGGYQWFSLRDWTPQSMLKGAVEAAPAIQLFIDLQMKRFGIADNKVALVGFSQGTMMALYAALRRPEPLAGVVGFSGALIGEDGVTSRPPVCLIHGTQDMVVPFGAMALAEAMLNHATVPVKTHARPGLGHGIDPEGLDIAAAFLKEKLA